MARWTEDWGRRLETAVDDEFTRLETALESEDGDPTDRVGEVYCGCEDCRRRTEWSLVMDATIAGLSSGEVFPD